MQKGMNEFDALESSIKGCVPINPYFSWHFPFIFLQNLFWIWSHEQIGFGELIRRSNRLDNNKVESVWEEYTNIMDHVKNLWSRYLQWVSENPTLATEMETSIKWISLIATGRNYWSDIEIFFLSIFELQDTWGTPQIPSYGQNWPIQHLICSNSSMTERTNKLFKLQMPSSMRISNNFWLSWIQQKFFWKLEPL